MTQAPWSVANMVSDVYHGNRNLRNESTNPTLDDILEAMHNLNRRERSSMCLLGTDDSVLCIGGGGEQFHLSLTTKTDVFVLCNPSIDDMSEVQIIIGSVLTPLPAKYIVDEDTAIRAVTVYYKTGNRAEDLEWIES